MKFRATASLMGRMARAENQSSMAQSPVAARRRCRRGRFVSRTFRPPCSTRGSTNSSAKRLRKKASSKG